MNRPPYPDEDGIPRRVIVIAAVVLAVAAFVMLAGPSNILGLLHLKDLETAADTPLPVNPQTYPMITPEELRPYVVGRTHVDPVLLKNYRQITSSGQSNVVIVPVKGGFELEFLLDGGGVVTATLIESATGSRLSVTTGTDAALYDSFMHLDTETETETDAPFIPPKPVAD